MLNNPNFKNIKKHFQHIDWMEFASIALIVIFGITLITTYFFPIYPDEIQARFWLSRLPYDFPLKISGAPTYLSTFFQPIPKTMYLPSFINWVLHGRLESIVSLRQIGFFVAFSWVLGLAIYINNKYRQSLVQRGAHLSGAKSLLYISGCFISVFSIGVFPFFLILNRSEQLILPSVILLIAVFLISKKTAMPVSLLKIIGLVSAYFAAVSLILFGHPKGLFLTPLFIIVACQLFSHFKSRLPIIIAIALLSLQVWQSFSTFKYAFQCNEMPQFEAMLKGFSFDPLSLFYDPYNFLDHASHSLISFTKYFRQLGFQEYTDISYLPIIPLSNLAKFANILITFNFVAIFCTLMIVLPSRYIRKDVVFGRFLTINSVLLTLLVCVLCSALFNIPKNWYDAGYLYALLLIILIYFVGENFNYFLRNLLVRNIYVYIFSVAMISQAIFIHRYLPAFLHGFVGPGVSIANYDSTKLNKELVNASRLCNIDPVNSKKLVVDDSTYFYFQKSKWPMAITYIWLGNDDKSIRKFFHSAESDGLIVSCSSMLDSFIPLVKREGSICCIDKFDLMKLDSTP